MVKVHRASTIRALHLPHHPTTQACSNAFEAIIYINSLLLPKITAGVVHFTLDHFGKCVGAISKAASIYDKRGPVRNLRLETCTEHIYRLPWWLENQSINVSIIYQAILVTSWSPQGTSEKMLKSRVTTGRNIVEPKSLFNRRKSKSREKIMHFIYFLPQLYINHLSI
jgi:hypothetical protein